MPSKAKYVERQEILTALEDIGTEGATIESILDAYDAANPSAFTNTSGLSDEKIAKAALKFVRTHLRRYPKNQGALTLSLKALFTDGVTSYQR